MILAVSIVAQNFIPYVRDQCRYIVVQKKSATKEKNQAIKILKSYYP